MNGPRIQNDERGITINKTLAWTMLTGLIVSGVVIGTETANTRAAIDSLIKAQDASRVETQTFRGGIDQRIRSLETARATGESETTALRRDLTAFREEMRELKDLLRSLERSLNR